MFFKNVYTIIVICTTYGLLRNNAFNLIYNFKNKSHAVEVINQPQVCLSVFFDSSIFISFSPGCDKFGGPIRQREGKVKQLKVIVRFCNVHCTFITGPFWEDKTSRKQGKEMHKIGRRFRVGIFRTPVVTVVVFT